MARLVLVPLVLSTLLFVGCKKKKDATEPPATTEAAASETEEAVVEQAPVVTEEAIPATVSEMVRNFELVFFDTDSTMLLPESKAALATNVGLMQEHPGVSLELQGHADERGTTDHNLALGNERADAVLQYLSASGIAPSRVRVVSYGEERPRDQEHSEMAWSRNRRCEFIITWTDTDFVVGTSDQ
ncbi:MAG: OmpA family protein [Myxococcota bacterium]|jgi:peptidoglycan-associated lipoprotein|nr:OmpA family protein [Myxococcota bacterium]